MAAQGKAQRRPGSAAQAISPERAGQGRAPHLNVGGAPRRRHPPRLRAAARTREPYFAAPEIPRFARDDSRCVGMTKRDAVTGADARRASGADRPAPPRGLQTPCARRPHTDRAAGDGRLFRPPEPHALPCASPCTPSVRLRLRRGRTPWQRRTTRYPTTPNGVAPSPTIQQVAATEARCARHVAGRFVNRPYNGHADTAVPRPQHSP